MVHQGIFTAKRYFHSPFSTKSASQARVTLNALHGSAHAAVIAGTQINDTTFVDDLFLCTTFVLATLCSHGDGERQP
jgi:hypothetical protein